MPAVINRNAFRQMDWPLIGVTLLLVFFGLATIFSVTHNQEVPDLGRFWKQVGFFAVGLGLLWTFSRTDYRYFSSGAKVLYGISIALLIAVLLFGSTIRGAKAWFTVGDFGVQPVEFVKLFVVFALARFLAPHLRGPLEWRTIGMTFIITAVPTGLVLLQPDLGSAMIFVAVWLGMLILARISMRKLLLILLALALLGFVFGNFFLNSTQLSRITVFLSPEKNCLGDAWNFCQSVTAVGSGEVFGRGLGLGPQSQLNFLPEQETDFIFAVIAEELGLVGATLLLVLFFAFFWRMFRLLREVRDGFALLLIGGFLIMFFTEMFVNVGMNMGLLPIAGIPLPLVSYGGSSLIASLVAVGIIEAVVARSRTALYR